MQQDEDYQMEYQASSSRRRQRSLIQSKSRRSKDFKRSKSCKNFDETCKHTFQFRQLSEEINIFLPLEITIKMCPQKQKIYDGSTEKLNTFPVIIVDEKPHMPLFVNECEIKTYMEHEDELLQNYEEKRRIQIKPSFQDHAPKDQYCSLCSIKYDKQYQENQYTKCINDLSDEYKRAKQIISRTSSKKSNVGEEFDSQILKTTVDSELDSQIKPSILFSQPVMNIFSNHENEKGQDQFIEKILIPNKSNLDDDQNIWNIPQGNLIQQNLIYQKITFKSTRFYTNKRAPNNLSYAKISNQLNSAFKRCNISTRPDESFQEESEYQRQQYSSQSIRNICKTLKFEDKNVLSNKKMVDESQENNLKEDFKQDVKNFKDAKEMEESQPKKGFQLNKNLLKDHLLHNHLKQKQFILEQQQKFIQQQDDCDEQYSQPEDDGDLEYESGIKLNQNKDQMRFNRNQDSRALSNSNSKQLKNHNKKDQKSDVLRASSTGSSKKSSHHPRNGSGGYKFNFDDVSPYYIKETDSVNSQSEVKQNDNKQKDNSLVQSKNKKRSFQEYNYQRGMEMSCEEEISINKKFKIFGIGTTEIKSFWQQFKDILGNQLSAIRQKINN